ncbi:MAG: hypothetical protein ACTHKV_01810 [Flavipsychrobacter sp.]
MSTEFFKKEEHPFEPFVRKTTKYLIIGTFPTKKENRRYEFYYSGERNNFWKVIEVAFNYTFKHKEFGAAKFEREKFLEAHAIGITDMHEICYRRNNRSNDDDLFILKLRDIFSLLESHPKIERLVFTSRTDIFGVKGLFDAYMLQNGLNPLSFDKSDNKIHKGVLQHKGRKIPIFIPYSPSPKVIENGWTTFPELVEAYKLCLT